MPRKGDSTHLFHGHGEPGGVGLADSLGTLTTTSTVINANAASTGPGGVYFLAGTITTTGTTITANTPTNCVGSPSPVPGCVG